MKNLPYFICDNEILNKAYRLAIGCVATNTISICSGLLKKEEPCVMAGLDYATPWTRDAAINVMNAVALLDVDVSKNTLLSVLEERDGKVFIGDQYWDAVIWGLGAYKLFMYNNDINFLKLSFEALKNTIQYMEENEYDEGLGLFRGPAVYGDGVSAYPDKYQNENLNSAIWTWQDSHPDQRYPKGYGLPMFALSTNCLYKEAYEVLLKISQVIGCNGKEYKSKAEILKKNINEKFWNSKKNTYDYLYKESDFQEGMGLSFTILFNIANDSQINKIINNTYITNYGIPCVYPSFERYLKMGYGRHSGTIWPHIQGFWAKAMKKVGQYDKFSFEMFALAKNAVRDMQFAEIYHPVTGEIYGGVQEDEGLGDKKYRIWKSCDYQTWSATAFLNMIFEGIFDIKLKEKGEIDFSNVFLPNELKFAELKNINIFGKRYDVNVKRTGNSSIKLETENLHYSKYFITI